MIISGDLEKFGLGFYLISGTPIDKLNLKNVDISYIKKIKNEKVKCLCGCGNVFFKYDSQGRERLYISGHNSGNKRLKMEDAINIRKERENGEKIKVLATNYGVSEDIVSKIVNYRSYIPR